MVSAVLAARVPPVAADASRLALLRFYSKTDASGADRPIVILTLANSPGANVRVRSRSARNSRKVSTGSGSPVESSFGSRVVRRWSDLFVAMLSMLSQTSSVAKKFRPTVRHDGICTQPACGRRRARESGSESTPPTPRFLRRICSQSTPSGSESRSLGCRGRETRRLGPTGQPSLFRGFPLSEHSVIESGGPFDSQIPAEVAPQAPRAFESRTAVDR